MSDIETRLRKIITEYLDSDHEITRESNIIDDLGADSLDMVELVMTTEEEFGVEISDDEWATVNTFGDAVDLVERLLG